MKSSFKAKVKCAQLGLKYIGTGRGFETAIESIGLLARWKAWPQRRLTQRERERLDSHRQIGFFHGSGFCPFRGRVSSHQPPVTRAVGRPLHLFCEKFPKIVVSLIKAYTRIIHRVG